MEKQPDKNEYMKFFFYKSKDHKFRILPVPDVTITALQIKFFDIIDNSGSMNNSHVGIPHYINYITFSNRLEKIRKNREKLSDKIRIENLRKKDDNQYLNEINNYTL